jgi:hypothetical protein
MISIAPSRWRFAAVVLAATALGAAATVPFAVWYDGYPVVAVIPGIVVVGALAWLLARHGLLPEEERARARATLAALAETVPETVAEVDDAGIVGARGAPRPARGAGAGDRRGAGGGFGPPHPEV